MSFNSAIKTIEALNEKVSTSRREALDKLPVSRIAAFNILGDVVSKAIKIVSTAKEIELRSEVKGKGVRKICGNWVLAKENNLVNLIRLKPLRAVSYDAKNEAITLANDFIKLVLSVNDVKIILRGKEFEVKGVSLDAINNSVDIIKSLGRYLLELTEELLTSLNICLKSLRGI